MQIEPTELIITLSCLTPDGKQHKAGSILDVATLERNNTEQELLAEYLVLKETFRDMVRAYYEKEA